MSDSAKVHALREEKAQLLKEAASMEANIEQMKKAGQRKPTIDRVREQLHKKYLDIDQKTRDIESLSQLRLF